ncbi:hypothetical protein [Marinobacter lipolyticus]|uniref:hypothetical protein n=1 Tax=Marinobacter lipolyticus TaxID=209639 RepID=UPI003A8FC4C5
MMRTIHSGLAFFLMLLLPTGQADALTISRLQARVSDADTYSFTQSIFHRFGDGTYVLQIYDNERGIDAQDNHERFELYVGRPINQLLGWVARGQKWSSSLPMASVGLQLDLNRTPLVDGALKSIKTTSFVQLFARNRSELLGDLEVLHYYRLKSPMGLPLEIRGNNVYYRRPEGGDLWNLWADVIHPVHRHWDIYYRWNFLSKANPLLGRQGHTSSIGFRFNF